MKMEQPVKAPCAGEIKEIKAKQADQVKAGDVLIIIG
jgi:biotin carboxyl carrier protein